MISDFVIDFDNVWKWLGFTRKDSAKKLLEKFFIIEINYKTVFRQQAENLNGGGRPRENIMLNVNTNDRRMISYFTLLQFKF